MYPGTVCGIYMYTHQMTSPWLAFLPVMCRPVKIQSLETATWHQWSHKTPQYLLIAWYLALQSAQLQAAVKEGQTARLLRFTHKRRKLSTPDPHDRLQLPRPRSDQRTISASTAVSVYILPLASL